MIRLDGATFTYPDTGVPALAGVELHAPEGELTLVVGPTGCGKSTLLKTLNGLVPHFTGGTLNGSVTVAGRTTRDHPPRELADVVGYVAQDPQQGFVTDTVEDELAYTMEVLAIPPATMRRRVEETLDLLGIAELRQRPWRTLSGGQRQRLAIGAALTAHPRILVLDEPTSALDPQGAEEVLSAIQRLVHDLGLTVVVSEHRLERVVQYADRVWLMTGDGSVSDFDDPAAAMAAAPIHPPVVALGRWAGWSPLPLSIRDARRLAVPLRRALLERAADDPGPAVPPAPQGAAAGQPGVAADRQDPDSRSGAPGGDRQSERSTVFELTRVSSGYGPVRALQNVSLRVRAGEVVAVTGRNGSGKSSLLALLAGQRLPDSGTVRIVGTDPVGLRGAALLRSAALVPQEPQDLLWSPSVAAECRAADRDAEVAAGTTQRLFDELRPGVGPDTHPNDLSEGTRLALVVAIMLAADPAVLLLDEPTRGLDYGAKRVLAGLVAERARRGRSVVIATHDVELVAEVCTRMVMLADGEIVLDADARTAAVSSPAFAPQVAKIVAPAPFLTVAEVQQALPVAAAP